MTLVRSSLRSAPLLALALAAVTGCEIAMTLGDLDDTSTGAAATDDDPGGSSSSSGASSGTTGMAEGTTFGGETTFGETTFGETTDTGQDPACIPPPETVIFYVYANEETVTRPPFYTVVEADCVVQGVSQDGNIGTYTLECDEDGVPTPHELEVVRNTGPLALPMEAGTPVHLQVAMDFPIDYGGFTYIVVRDAAGELILGYYGGGTLPEGIGVDLAAWFAPLEFALAFGDCDPVPYEDPGISFIQPPCPADRTPLAVDFQLGPDEIHLIEENGGQLGPLSLFVTSARHLDPLGECDSAIDAFSFVAYRTP